MAGLQSFAASKMELDIETLSALMRREGLRAFALKRTGNEQFKAGDLVEAYESYGKALRMLTPIYGLDTVLVPAGDKHLTIGALRLMCVGNQALVAFKLGWYVTAVLDGASAVSIAKRYLDNATETTVTSTASACIATVKKLYKKAIQRRVLALQRLGLGRRAAAERSKLSLDTSDEKPELDTIKLQESSDKIETRDVRADALPYSAPQRYGSRGEYCARSDWGTHVHWFIHFEKFLTLADLARLQGVNRSWRAGLQSNIDAWIEAEQSVLGHLLKGRSQLRHLDSQDRRVQRVKKEIDILLCGSLTRDINTNAQAGTGLSSAAAPVTRSTSLLTSTESNVSEPEQDKSTAVALPPNATQNAPAPATTLPPTKKPLLTPIVLELGIGYSKVGYAGQSTPTVVSPNYLTSYSAVLSNKGELAFGCVFCCTCLWQQVHQHRHVVILTAVC